MIFFVNGTGMKGMAIGGVLYNRNKDFLEKHLHIYIYKI